LLQSLNVDDHFQKERDEQMEIAAPFGRNRRR